jgi:hypothetical protein
MFPRFMPCNSLKSLDSDEIIQDNPTLICGGLRGEKARAKKTQTDRCHGPLTRRSQTDFIQLQSARRRDSALPLKTREGYRLRFDATRRRHSIWSFPSGRPVIRTGGGCCETTGGGGSCGGAG